MKLISGFRTATGSALHQGRYSYYVSGALSILVLAALSACGQPTPEDRLSNVSEQLENSTVVLEDLNQRIEEAQDNLDELVEKRRDLRDKVRTLEQRLEARATDVAIFRAVQSALLESEELQESAISVAVEDGAVVLSGIVRTAEERSEAVQLARNSVGVRSVTVRIRVKDDRSAENNVES